MLFTILEENWLQPGLGAGKEMAGTRGWTLRTRPPWSQAPWETRLTVPKTLLGLVTAAAPSRDTLSLKARVMALRAKQNMLCSNSDSSSQPLPPPRTSISPFYFLNTPSEMVGASGILLNCDLGDEI